jgi:hypothetical protein
MKIDISMHTIQFLVLTTAIAALIAGLNVAQVAQAQSKGTCVINTQTTDVVNNVKNGNPHCFDPEQQPTGTPIPPNAGTGPPGPGSVGCAGQTACLPESSHPQSLNPQDKVVGDPHEDPKPGILPNNPQGQTVGNPHVFCR